MGKANRLKASVRNGPCSCGSGAKAKKCCAGPEVYNAAVDEQDRILEERWRIDREEVEANEIRRKKLSPAMISLLATALSLR